MRRITMRRGAINREVQGLLGQCALATVAILGTLATLNLQFADLIIQDTKRIPPLRSILKSTCTSKHKPSVGRGLSPLTFPFVPLA